MAADLQNPSAQTALGVCYYSGLGVERDFSAAVHWLQRAALQGDQEAQVPFAFSFRT